MANKGWLIVLGLIMLSACRWTRPKVDKIEYIKWVQNEKNGLRKTKRMGEVNVLLQFKPIEYMALREYDNKGPESFAATCKQYNGMQYYDMSIDLAQGSETILKHDLPSEDAFYNRLNYFSFQIQDDITLQEGDSILNCRLYHFERSYDLSKHSTMLLGFAERKGHEMDTKVVAFDATKLGLGIVKIEITSSDLEKVPQLKL